MIIYEKYEYSLKLLSKEDGKDIFKYLAKYKIKDDFEAEERYFKRAHIKEQIVGELEIDKHIPIGIYNSDELIGICFTEAYNKNKLAKISYLKLDDEYINTIVPDILFYFLIHDLYSGIKITFNNKMMNKFGDITRMYPKVLNVSTFSDKYSEEIKQYFGEN